MPKKFRLRNDKFARTGTFDGRRFIDDTSAKDYWSERVRGEKMINDDEGRLFLKYLPWMIGSLAFGAIVGFGAGWQFSVDSSDNWLSGYMYGIATCIFIAFVYKKGWRLLYLMYHGVRSAFRGQN